MTTITKLANEYVDENDFEHGKIFPYEKESVLRFAHYADRKLKAKRKKK